MKSDDTISGNDLTVQITSGLNIVMTKTSEGVEGFAVATLEHEPSRTGIVVSFSLRRKARRIAYLSGQKKTWTRRTNAGMPA